MAAVWRRLRGVRHQTRNTTAGLQFHAVSQQVAFAVLGVVRAALVVRALGPGRYGLVVTALAVAGIFSQLLHLGLGTGSAKLVARAADRSDASRMVASFLAIRAVALVPIVGALVLIGGPVAGAVYGSPNMDAYVGLAALTVVTSAPTDILLSSLTGLDRFHPYFRLKLGYEIAQTVFVPVGTILFGIVGYFVAQAATNLVLSVGGFVEVRRSLGCPIAKPRWSDFRTVVRPVLRTSGAIYVARLLRTLASLLPLLITGAVLGTTAGGQLGLGMKAASYVDAMAAGVVVVALPRMTRLRSELGASAVVERFAGNFRRISRGMALIVTPLIVLLPIALPLVAGPGFRTAGLVGVVAVCASALLTLGSAVGSGIFLPLDWEWRWVRAQLVAVVAAVAGSIVLLHLTGSPIGAAAAALLAYAVLAGAVARSLATIGQARFFLEGCARVVMWGFVGIGVLLVLPGLPGLGVVAVITIAHGVFVVREDHALLRAFSA